MFNRAIGFAPYGVYWRTLRRIASEHFFCPKQILSTTSQRLSIASQMVSYIYSLNGNKFTVRDLLRRASLNNIMCSVFGRKYDLFGFDEYKCEVEELRGLVDEGYELLGKLNWSDHLPWLASLDLQRIRFGCNKLIPRVNQFVNRIIQEHRNQIGKNHEDRHDFVEVLLSLQDRDKLSDHDMVAVLWEMIFRGSGHGGSFNRVEC